MILLRNCDMGLEQKAPEYQKTQTGTKEWERIGTHTTNNSHCRLMFCLFFCSTSPSTSSPHALHEKKIFTRKPQCWRRNGQTALFCTIQIWQALKAEENPWQELKKNKYTTPRASSERSKGEKSDGITKEPHYHANAIYSILSQPSQ